MAKAKTNEPADPNKLTRESAGSYRTGDGRFEVRQGGVGWYLVDLERANELGQELLHGPFPSLKEARAEIDNARKVVPLAKPRPRPTKPEGEAPAPPPPPKTWIDRLPESEQKEVRRLIATVERAGIDGAEKLVKEARSSEQPVLAAALVEHKLQALIDAAEPDDRRARRDLVRKVLAILADEGSLTGGLPGWELVERDPDRKEPRRLRPTV
jgi:hypothetical protein